MDPVWHGGVVTSRRVRALGHLLVAVTVGP
ncbi:hypothetical protein IWX63_001619 [Arthrobacter sp. CAN_A2]